ncbi:MAG TPA: tandem-95 repeat protein [Allosphingosinicella sp.]|jgi:Ca2+-binding RTX toxin-like protein
MPRILLYSPDANGQPNGIGTGWRIGDGVILTAGHVVFEFNEKSNPANRAKVAIPGTTIYYDPREYAAAYDAQIATLPNPLPSPNSNTTISGQFVEFPLRSKDMIFIEGGGTVNSSDAGIAVYLNPSDIAAPNFSLVSGTTLSRDGRISHKDPGTVNSMANGGYVFSLTSIPGDSGGAHLLRLEGKEFVVGNTVTNATFATMFTAAEFHQLNRLLSGAQSGNVTSAEPTNLIVGSNAGDGIVFGTYRADIILGRGGNETLWDEPLAATNAWGSDQLFGGAGNDSFRLAFGDDLAHGGDHRNYGGARTEIEDDGKDEVDYSAALQSEPIEIRFKSSNRTHYSSTTDFNKAIFVEQTGVNNGTDTLISIEKIVATDGNDILEIEEFNAALLAGADGTGGLAEIDFAGNHGGGLKGDLIDVTKVQEKLTIDLSLAAGFIQVEGDAEKKVRILNAERAWGGENDDKIKGNDEDNELKGGKGNDEIKGQGGKDKIEGGEGNDRIEAGDGEDLIDGGSEDDVIKGDAGNDILKGAEGNDEIDGGADTDEIDGGAGDDKLTGGAGDDVLRGGEGNDILDGVADNGASDQLIGPSGTAASLATFGGGSGDQLYGGGGGDTFKTDNGDTIFDPDGGDSVYFGALRLRGGERELPPENPCQPPDRNEDDNEVKSGTYKGRNGDVYQYDKEGSALTVSGPEGTIVLLNWRNGAGGIKLKNERPPVQPAECNCDPLILDLNNDKNVVAEIYDVSVYFDMNNDGIQERVSWALPEDGLLTLDHNGDGVITSGAELFGNATIRGSGQGTATIGTSGFSELASLDSNRDLKIDANDADFAALRVWQDANSDGVSDNGELKSLGELGIVSISLITRASDDFDCGCDGTLIPFMSDARMTDGSKIGVYDAFLAVDNYDTIHTGLPDVPEDITLLPFLAGSGKVVDLHVAMTRDPVLREMVEALITLDVSKVSELPGLVERILFRWTGADQVFADGRGPSFNGQWLKVIEAFNGSDFRQNGSMPDPQVDAASDLAAVWRDLLDLSTAQLLGQIPVGQAILPGLTFEAGAFFIVASGTQLSDLFQSLASHAPSAMSDRTVYWHVGLAGIAAAAHEFGMSAAQIDAAATSWLGAAGIGMTATEVRKLILGGDAVYGTDTLFSNTAPEWLHATADAAILHGGSVDDHYIVRNGQSVTIQDVGGLDEVRLTDLSSVDAAVSYLAVDGIYILTVQSLDGLTKVVARGTDVANELNPPIDRIRFADGVLMQVFENMAQGGIATDGDDVVSADPQLGSLLDGGLGSDTLLGHNGNDEFVVGPGKGSDRVVERGGSNGDVLLIGATRLQTIFEISHDLAGRDLIVRFVGASDTIVIQGQRLSEGFAIETFRFSDGETISAAALEALLLSGTPGTDILIGGYRDDRLDGGESDDLLVGGGGQDIYIFGRSSGHDIVRDGNLSIIEFESGVSLGDLVLRRGGDNFADLVIELGRGTSLLIENQMVANRILEFRFADGSPVPWSALQPLVDQSGGAEIRGTSYDDLDQRGTAGNDVHFAGKGNDRIIDQGGNDTYLFRRGDGADTITDLAGVDTVQFGEGISEQDLRWFRDGSTLIINVAEDGGRLTIPQFFVAGSNSIERVLLYDGTVVTLTTIADATVGTSGDDYLFDLSEQSNQYLGTTAVYHPGTGNDLITATRNGGVVHLDAGFGHDTYVGIEARYFESNGVGLEFGAGLSAADVRARRDGSDLIVYFQNSTDEFRAVGHFGFVGARASVSRANFLDGVVLGSVLGRMALAPTSGDDDIRYGAIIDGVESNVRDGGAGNDILRGNGANYVFGVGYGHDLVENSGSAGSITFVGLALSDVILSRSNPDPMDIVVTITATGETLTIAGHISSYGGPSVATAIGQLIFTDATLDTPQALAKIIEDGVAAGVSTFEAAGKNVSLALGAGNQTVIAGEKGVSLLLDSYSGRDTLIPKLDQEAGGIRIRMADISPGEFKAALFYDLTGDAPGWRLALGAGPNSLLILPYLEKHAQDGSISGWDIEVAFPGNSYMYGTHIASLLRAGLGGGIAAEFGLEQLQVVVGTAGTDILRSGSGSQVLVGLEGQDTFVLGADTGHDIVAGVMWLLGDPAKDRGDTIKVEWNRNSVSFAWTGSADGQLKITGPGGDASMAFNVYDSHEFRAMGWIEFADGERLSSEQLVADLLAAAGNASEVLQGDWDANILDGHGGDDTMAGGPGDDNYVFGRGYGHDVIIERDPWGEGLNDDNSVRFAPGITAADLVFTRSGDGLEDLVVTIVGDNDSLTILNQFGTWRPIVEFQFADGSRLSWQKVHDLAAGLNLAGDNLLQTGARGGVLDGGPGNDVLRGGTGNDVYVMARGYDEDLVVDAGGSEDILRFSPGVAPKDVMFSWSPDALGDLLVEVTGVERLALTIRGQLTDASAEIEFFEFADFTRLSARDIAQRILAEESTSDRDVLQGSRFADRIDARAGRDSIIGGKGDDRIDGGPGYDIAVFSGQRTDYDIVQAASGTTVRDLRADGDGTDLLFNVEALQFLGNGTAALLYHLVPPNTAPVTGNDMLTMAEDSVLVIATSAILQNDQDPDQDQLALVRVLNPASGDVWIGIDGNIRFRSSPNFTGTASFSYEVRDPNGETSVAQVLVLVTGVNDGPALAAGTIVVTEDSVGPLMLGSDLDGDSLTYTVLQAPASGTLHLDAESGAYRYVPVANFFGTDGFAMTVSDGKGGTSTAHYFVQVLSVNDVPIAPEVLMAATAGLETLATVVAADADDAVLSFAVVGYPDQGDLKIDSSTGAMIYRPRLDATGTDRATIAVLDPSGAETFVEITIAVAPATIQLSAASVLEGADAGTVVADASVSVEGEGATELVYRLVEDAGGRLTIDPETGVITISNGAVIDFETAVVLEIVVEASDGIDSITARFDVQVFNVAPSTPQDADQSANVVSEDASLGAPTGLVVSALDPAGGSLTYALTVNADGRFSIDPLTGAVLVAGALHYETAAFHEIVVSVSDGGLAVTRTFRIDVSEAPEILGTDAADSLGGTARADEIRGLGGDDLLFGLAGNDDLEGGTGNDILDGGTGADLLRGGSGDDVYLIDDVADVVYEVALEGTDEVRTTLLSYALEAHLEKLTFDGTGGFTGYGNAANNSISGGSGNDLIVHTQGGVDSAFGGLGNDLVYFGGTFTADDIAHGGAGTDTLALAGVYNLTFGAGSLIEVEKLDLYSGSQVGSSPTSFNITTVDANVSAGSQLVVWAMPLLPTEQLIFVGMAETNGSFSIRSGAASDILVGGDKADVIYGGAGNDQIYGMAGNDTLVGGLGADQLTGGNGIDYLRFESAGESPIAAPDRINLFQATTDKIDLSLLDANAATAANDAFTFIGSAAFGGTAGQLRTWNNGTDTFVEGDLNGDGVGDFRIIVTGVAPLAATDFIL